jgi:hypothetical protein
MGGLRRAEPRCVLSPRIRNRASPIRKQRARALRLQRGSARRERKPPRLEPETRDPQCLCKASGRGRARLARSLASARPIKMGSRKGRDRRSSVGNATISSLVTRRRFEPGARGSTKPSSPRAGCASADYRHCRDRIDSSTSLFPLHLALRGPAGLHRLIEFVGAGSFPRRIGF